MKRSKFGEERITGILTAHAAGPTASEQCRKHGIGAATLHKGRSEYGGMEVSEAECLTALDEKNASFRKQLAESMPGVSTLHEMLGKTSDARFGEDCREPGRRGQGLVVAPGL